MDTCATDQEQTPKAPKRRKLIREQLKEANDRIDILVTAVLALELAMTQVVQRLKDEEEHRNPFETVKPRVIIPQ